MIIKNELAVGGISELKCWLKSPSPPLQKNCGSVISRFAWLLYATVFTGIGRHVSGHVRAE